MFQLALSLKGVSCLQVQQRVDDLIRVLNFLIGDLSSYVAHWENLLDKLNVININCMQVSPFWAMMPCHALALAKALSALTH